MTSNVLVHQEVRTARKTDVRWHPGVILVTLIAILQIVLAAAADRAVAPQVVRWSIQMPVTVFAVDLLYRRIKQMNRPYATVVATITLAAVLGTIFGTVVSALSIRYPMLRVRPDQTIPAG